VTWTAGFFCGILLAIAVWKIWLRDGAA